MELGLHHLGPDMGPRALRASGLKQRLEALGHCIVDKGDLEIKAKESSVKGSKKSFFFDEIQSYCETISALGKQFLKEDSLPLFIGGDHSISMGSIAGVAQHYKESTNKKIGVIWFDAHADMNTPVSSESGNVHGMSLAALLGSKGFETLKGGPFVEAKHVCVIGARDVDPKEKKVVKQEGVHVISMKELDKIGIHAATQKAIEIAGTGTAGIHLSLDLDGLDPSIAPGVSTPVQGGLTFRESHLFCEMLYDSGLLRAVDLVELNPLKDNCNQTGLLALGLMESLFGKQILS